MAWVSNIDLAENLAGRLWLSRAVDRDAIGSSDMMSRSTRSLPPTKT